MKALMDNPSSCGRVLGAAHHPRRTHARPAAWCVSAGVILETPSLTCLALRAVSGHALAEVLSPGSGSAGWPAFHGLPQIMSSESWPAGHPLLAVKVSITNRAVTGENCTVAVLPVAGSKV
jgi:hypothetical protein